MVRRFAETVMGQRASFLTSPGVAPGTEQASGIAMADGESSREAGGIFRICRPKADPVATARAGAVGEDETYPVPLPPRRPATLASSRETLTLAESHR